MAIGSYPRVTVQGTGATNNIQNGLGLMVLNPSTQKYEAATAATFAGGGGGGGDATAANQATQISQATDTNSFLSTISINTSSLAALTDVSYSVVNTNTDSALPSQAAKKITLINISTNTAAMEIKIGGSSALIPLEVGYSLVLNVTNANSITTRQAGGEGQTLYYIISN
jgi:hypothetical protein